MLLPRTSVCAGFVLVLCLSCRALTAQPDSLLFTRVDSLFARWDKPSSPGCAVGVIRDGKLIYARGYGRANLDYDIPIGAASKFYIASTSKQFTAACIALLAVRGKLSLDDDIRKYLSEFPDYGTPVTIRHLVHHTSGIRDYLALMQLGGKSFEDYFDQQDAIRIICRQKALNFQPGSEYLYSNSGYVLLAEIVRRVSGTTLRKFAGLEFLAPLGMANTFFNDDHNQVITDRVISYRPDWPHGYRQFLQNFDAVGDGNLLTTVNDLYLWDQNFYHAKAGGAEWLRLMLTPGMTNNGDSLDYAFGLRKGSYRGSRTIDHGGAMLGFRTQLLRFPDQRFSAVVLANSMDINAGGLAYQVADIFLEGRLMPKPPRRPAPDRQPGEAMAKAGVSEAAPPDLGEYAGDYYSEELESTYHFFLEGNALRVRVGRLDPVSLSFRKPDLFSTQAGEVTFRRDPSNRISGFRLDSGRVKGLAFEKK